MTAFTRVFSFAFILAVVCDYNSSKTPVIIKCTIISCTVKKGKKNPTRLIIILRVHKDPSHLRDVENRRKPHN